MIIEGMLNVFYNVFGFLTELIDIPNMPDNVQGFLDTALDYMQAGAGIIANYVHLDYLLALFGILIAIDLGISIYHLVMWIIRKIPLAGMS